MSASFPKVGIRQQEVAASTCKPAKIVIKKECFSMNFERVLDFFKIKHSFDCVNVAHGLVVAAEHVRKIRHYGVADGHAER